MWKLPSMPSAREVNCDWAMAVQRVHSGNCKWTRLDLLLTITFCIKWLEMNCWFTEWNKKPILLPAILPHHLSAVFFRTHEHFFFSCFRDNRSYIHSLYNTERFPSWFSCRESDPPVPEILLFTYEEIWGPDERTHKSSPPTQMNLKSKLQTQKSIIVHFQNT